MLEVVNLRSMFRDDAPSEGSIEEPLTVIAELRARGLIRHIGLLSNVTPARVEEGRSTCEIVCVQNLYNLADRSDDAVVEALAHQGIAYVAYFPLGGIALVQSTKLSEVARRLNASPMRVAIAWPLHRSPNLLPIPGISSPAHLRENIAASTPKLSASEFEALSRTEAAV